MKFAICLCTECDVETAENPTYGYSHRVCRLAIYPMTGYFTFTKKQNMKQFREQITFSHALWYGFILTHGVKVLDNFGILSSAIMCLIFVGSDTKRGAL